MVGVIQTFGTDSTNIIYSPRRDSAEKWSIKLSDSVQFNEDNEMDEQVKDLTDYLSQEIRSCPINRGFYILSIT